MTQNFKGLTKINHKSQVLKDQIYSYFIDIFLHPT
jgi:hypothetical protein